MDVSQPQCARCPKGRSLEDVLGSIGSLCCMAFIQQNALDPPIGNLFDASLTRRFLLTFPLIAIVGKIGGFLQSRFG